MRRRTVLQGGGVTLLGAAALGSLPLFSSPDRRQDPSKRRARDISASSPTLTISNWPLYIDEDDDGYVSTLTEFKKKYDAKVSYHTDVTDNVVFFNKVVNQLGSGASTGRDMFMLSDWMAARMITMGWIQPIDPASVPHLHQNIISSLKAPDWDPERKYSAPWQAGFTGIAYNKKYLAKPPATIKELLTHPDLKGKVAVMTEMRDTMGLTLLGLGYDPSHFTSGQWDEAIELLTRAKKSGHIRAFSGQEYTDDLTAGNTVACIAWSGDIAAAGDPNLQFVIPEEGMMIWADNMLIPNMAQHQSLAEKWIDFYYEPENAAKLANYNYFVSPVQGIEKYIADLDPDVLDDDALRNLILPDAAYLKQTHAFMALTEVQNRTYEKDFSDVSGV